MSDERVFPVQADGRHPRPLRMTWEEAQDAYRYYVALMGWDHQSLTRIGERGGFSRNEVEHMRRECERKGQVVPTLDEVKDRTPDAYRPWGKPRTGEV